MSKNMNKQNEFIATNLTNVVDVVTRLVEMGVTVLSIKIEDRSPRITVQYSPACRNIHAVTQIRKFDRGQRLMCKVSVMNRCMVQWWQPEEVAVCG